MSRAVSSFTWSWNSRTKCVDTAAAALFRVRFDRCLPIPQSGQQHSLGLPSSPFGSPFSLWLLFGTRGTQPVAVWQRSAILSLAVLQEADEMRWVTRIT